MKKKLRKWGIRLGILLVFLLVLFLVRVPILKGLAGFLDHTDVPIKVDAGFVLSGAASERTQRAMEMYPAFAPVLVTTGEMVSQALLALDQHYTSAEVMRDALLRAGADSSDVRMLPRGTSTYEESEEILGYSVGSGYKRVMIVSSLHHTRRIHHVFERKFREADIEVVVIGAQPLDYDPGNWWNDEEGLIFVMNEYAKLVYYWWKY